MCVWYVPWGTQGMEGLLHSKVFNGLISIIDTQVPTLVHVLLNDVYNLTAAMNDKFCPL